MVTLKWWLHYYPICNESCHGSHKNWKTWKNEKTFSSQGKSENFEQTGKVGEFHPKYWKNEGILPKILEKWGHFSQFLYYFFLLLLIEVYVLNWFIYFLNSLNAEKILENGKKILEKSWKFVSPKMWEPWLYWMIHCTKKNEGICVWLDNGW